MDSFTEDLKKIKALILDFNRPMEAIKQVDELIKQLEESEND